MLSAFNVGLISNTSVVGLEIGEKQEPRLVSNILIDTNSMNSLISRLFGREYVSNVTTIVPLVNATVVVPGKETEQRRCEEILYTEGCTLLDCGKQCYQKYIKKGGMGNAFPMLI
ncbi:unnamed protein product [Dovyalis caffra]|uniref:Uncharacterized protein n=1 Tax=Dovyalis caffra TaxID=77055 RepID=A0AAV1S1H1_9ROSI|nr:unnamed protein product [Dovyalis caffra]